MELGDYRRRVVELTGCSFCHVLPNQLCRKPLFPGADVMTAFEPVEYIHDNRSAAYHLRMEMLIEAERRALPDPLTITTLVDASPAMAASWGMARARDVLAEGKPAEWMYYHEEREDGN
jgi:hypothetical protein